MTKLFKNLLILSVLCFASNSMANDSSTFGTEDEGMPSALSDILFGGEDVSESQENIIPSDGLSIASTDMEDPSLRVYSSKLTLTKLGRKDGIVMSAGQKAAGVNFTLPVDKMVVSGRMELFISMTEAMAERASHLNVKVNGQSIGTLPLNRSELTDFELQVPAEYMSQENGITFEIDDDEEFTCMIDYSGKYKIKIDAESYLALNGYRMDIDPSLDLFPLPFLDKYENGKTTVNYVLPEEYDTGMIKAATMLSSFFGREAEYRGVDFKVSFDSLPTAHAIVFGHPGQKVAGIEMPEKPGVYIRSNPYYSIYKNIYVVAKNDSEFVRAVTSLCVKTEEAVYDYLAPSEYALPVSEAYDAPFWLPTNRKVYLRDLLKGDQSLVTRGFWHSALNLSFRAAPDLYQLYEGQGDLYINYEFPLERSVNEQDSGLNISLSGHYLDKLPMNKKGLLENIWRLSGGDIRETERHLQIPPSMIYGDNNLEMYFDLRLNPKTSCAIMQDTNIKSVIDESSYIDFTNSVHYAKLPNLSFFVGASFPFSRYADFSRTAILLPKNPSANEFSMLFDMAGRAGNATGTLVYNENIYLGNRAYNQDDAFLIGKDILVVSTLKRKEFLAPLFENSAFELGRELHIYDYGVFSLRGGFFAGLTRFLSGDFRSENVDANRYVRTSSSWRGFLSLVSPFDSEHIAVLVTATDDNELLKITSDLDKNSVNRAIGGDISIITGADKVVKYTVGDHIFSGDVSTSFEILHFAGEHVFWLSVVAFIIIIVLSFIASTYLQKRAKRRLAEGYEDNNLK